jgi:aryl-alcohol dehydrogenase-like predicted oxidoreductase
VAIRWVLARPEVTTAIVGCDTAEQVDANMTGLDFELSDEQLTRLNDASADVVVPVR